MTERRVLLLVALLLGFLTVSASNGFAQNQITISTLANTGDPRVSSGLLWGFGGYVSGGQFTEINGVGQTFTTPKHGLRLDQFRFFLAGGDNCSTAPIPCDMVFQMLLVRWNPTVGIIGSIMWNQLMTLGPLDADNQVINTALTANPMIRIGPGTYAALMLAVAPGSSVPLDYEGYLAPDLTWLATNSDADPWEDLAYPGGMALTYNGAPGFHRASWQSEPNIDFSFDATMTVTPEPVSMVLLGTGLAGLAAIRRRRRNRDR